MGKRSTNTTKSGKFMNPTDQARKEARKKELKKNKKQRQMVRSAVLKGKNPREIVSELEKLDDMEFNILAPPPLNDKVLRDKRRKLHETWQRVIRMYEKDDVEQYVELKRLWHSYQNRKNEVMEHYDSVKNAQNVVIDDIPLPSAPEGETTDSIPLPPSILMQPKSSILKKPSVLESLKPKSCPGVPSGPPPLLTDYCDESDGEKGDKESAVRSSKRIRFDDEGSKEGGQGEEDVVAPGEESGPQVDEIQRKMLMMAGQDVDQYMKEMEEVHRQTQSDKAVELQSRLSRMDESTSRTEQTNAAPAATATAQIKIVPSGPPGMPLLQAPLMPPRPPILYRPAPPPLRPGMAPPSVRLPPGPPPLRPGMAPPSVRPPMMMRPPSMRPNAPRPSGGVVSAAPQLNKDSAANSGSTAGGPSKAGMSVIEAKPQMRNLKSDITRFVPTNVRVKRDGPTKKRPSDPLTDVFKNPHHAEPQQKQQNNKDDAYSQFMQEINHIMK